MKTILSAMIMLLFAACTSDSLEKDYRRLKSGEITLPQYQTAFINGEERVFKDFSESKLKLIVFCDSTSCNNCAIESIYCWEDYIEYAKKLGNQLCYYFIFTPKQEDLDNVRTTLAMTEFNYPVILDSTGVFRKQNPHIPTHKIYHTFLIDENNKVVMVGNPLNDKKIETLFKTTVQELLTK